MKLTESGWGRGTTGSWRELVEDKHNQTTLFKYVILSQDKLNILNENNADRPTWLTKR